MNVLAALQPLIYFIAFINGAFSTKQTTLDIPSEISALSSDVTVVVRNPIAGTVELFKREREGLITGQIVAKSNETETSLVFDCGYFASLGEYVFNFRSRDGLVEVQSVLPVTKWPKVAMTWKSQHDALTTDVKVTINIHDEICTSDIAKKHKMFIRLLKYPYTVDQNVGMLTNGALVPEVTSQSDVEFPPTSSIFPCEKFNQEGEYKTEVLFLNDSDDVIVGSSDIMKVYWSREYQLNVPKDVTNCKGSYLYISFSVPPCASSYDVISVHSYYKNTSQIIANQTIEFAAMVAFSCSLFTNTTNVEGFCFHYVTQSGYVMRSVCQAVPSKTKVFTVDGTWSSWNSWSVCKRPCMNATKSRKRFCDNPKPEGEGKECITKEESFMLEEWDSDVEEVDAHCNEFPAISSLMSSSVSLNKSCECGCQINANNSGLIVSNLNSKCGRNVIWTVHAPKDHVIRFRVLDYQLHNEESISVRDGRISWPLMARYPSVTTKFGTAIVQLFALKSNIDLNSCGFILLYEVKVAPTRNPNDRTPTPGLNSSTVENEDVEFIAGMKKWFQDAVDENPVLFGSIAALVVLILLVFILAISYHCKLRRKKKQRDRGTEFGTQRSSTPPDGRSCSTESEPMMRKPPQGESDNFDMASEAGNASMSVVKPGTAYYLAQRQLDLMKKLGQNQSTQMYATLGLDDRIKDQEDLLFGSPSTTTTPKTNKKSQSLNKIVV